jgi:hypothetical protein
MVAAVALMAWVSGKPTSLAAANQILLASSMLVAVEYL